MPTQSPPFLMLLLPGVLLAQVPIPAEPPPPPPPQLIANLGGACQVFQQHYDAAGADLEIRFGVALWNFRITNSGMKGPWIEWARFKGGDMSTTRLIFQQAGLADVFVKYHGGKGIYDLNPWSKVPPITAGDLPPAGGGLVTLRVQSGTKTLADTEPRIGVECRERGIDWVCKQPGINRIGRGYEVIVWAIIDGGNYDNILQYIFRDDGSVGFRLGTSGFLNEDQDLQPQETHMHDALWRVNLRLFGRLDNRIYRVSHTENGNTASDAENMVTQEGAFDWMPMEFTSLLVESQSQKNSRGNKMGYEFAPWGITGSSRHSEAWAQHDFWITRWKVTEEGQGTTSPNNWRSGPNHITPDLYMMSYANGENLNVNMAPVIWYRSSFHHHSTDADLASDGSVGIVSAHSAGFDLKPHNLFATNPMTGGQKKCTQ